MLTVRRAGFKIPWAQARVGSSPTSGTTEDLTYSLGECGARAQCDGNQYASRQSDEHQTSDASPGEALTVLLAEVPLDSVVYRPAGCQAAHKERR